MKLFDDTIYQFISSFHTDWITTAMIFISFMASGFMFVFITMLILITVKDKKTGKYIAINLISVFILNQILKLLINRERPDILWLTDARGYSFPSGHSMVSAGFYGYIIYLLNQKIENKQIKYPMIIGLTLFVLLVGISRIYLGVHYASDVLGGFIIGILYVVVYIKLIKKNESV